MLPMLFAPTNDQAVTREYPVPVAKAETLAVWPRARELAAGSWEIISTDDRISVEFCAVAKRATDSLRAAR
jgi:hypothetical protein